MPESVPTCTWASEMGVREKGEGRDGEMERLRQEDFMLAGLNAAHSPQPKCGTGVLLQSAAPWRQMDPPSRDTHIHPCGIRVTERGWWTAGIGMGSGSLWRGQPQLALQAGGWQPAGELVARWDVGPAFPSLFSAFQGSRALWWWQGVGR